LSWHIALCKKEYFFIRCGINCYINNDNGMTRRYTFNKDVSNCQLIR